ncbi:MBL fold metallo-hydrolase, partial [Nanoarchaeota archaeon]
MIEIIAIGGYNEVGKNMTAIKVDNEIIVLDMGLHLPNYIKVSEDDDLIHISEELLHAAEAIPDDSVISQWKDMVKAIIPSHAHLDHIGAIPYMAKKYKCPVLCTAFTAQVIKTICKDEKIKLKNPIQVLNENAKYTISKNIKIEFINMTHSTPQTVTIAVHTPYGTVVYANDFKFDNYPVLGKKPNYKRLEELGKGNVVALIIDSLYADQAMKTPSENTVRQMLKEVILDTPSKNKAIIITTFSSHLARLKSIIDFSKKLTDRKIVFLGRSLAKYVQAGEDVGLIKFSEDAKIVKFSKQIKRELNRIQKIGVDKFVLVVTGHQGEPQATLSKMTNKVLPFQFHKEDLVIFSCKTIPTDINIENRAHL